MESAVKERDSTVERKGSRKLRLQTCMLIYLRRRNIITVVIDVDDSSFDAYMKTSLNPRVTVIVQTVS